MKKLILATSLLAGAATMANAGVMAEYEITNFNGGNGLHGLWTNGDKFGGDNTFSISSGTFTVYDDLTADFIALASNDYGYTAQIDLDLSDFSEMSTYKKESGKAASEIVNGPAVAAPDNQDIDFFNVLSGTISISNDNPLYNEVFNMENCCAPVFQFGNGANAKNSVEFGASSWIGLDNGGPGGPGKAGHWDLNVALVQVPEPGSIALLGMGLLGLGFARRNAKA